MTSAAHQVYIAASPKVDRIHFERRVLRDAGQQLDEDLVAVWRLVG